MPRPNPAGSAHDLNLTDGKALVLADIPANEAAAIALIGGKTVVAPPFIRRPAIRARPGKTDKEVEADVKRQAEALALQRQQLAAESQRLRSDRWS